MTTGEFTSFPVAQIFVNREGRQRREIGDVSDLAQSIRDHGLIHPPVIKRDGELIVGERRWTAIKSLGWTHVSVQFIEDLEPNELRAVELEENLKRKDITWQEECLAVQEYHKVRATSGEDWTPEKTADALGISRSLIYDKLNVAKEVASGNSRVIAAPKYSTASSIVTRDNTRRKETVLASLGEPNDSPQVKQPPLLNVDFNDWRKQYTGPQFNVIHCDFPYGVGMHKSEQAAGAEFGTYADSPDVYWELLTSLADSMNTIVAPSAHLMFWFSMDFYQRTFDELTAMGWKVNPFPLIWLKSDNTGIIPDSNRGPRRIYETAFFASRGDRPIVSAVSNGFSHAGREKEIHMNEKPVAMLKHFMRMFTDDLSLVLDPTCGSGNAIKAAESLKANTILGLERDPEFYSRAKEAYYVREEVFTL